MSGVNKVILLGRLGRDPEVRYTPDGRAICNFSIATSEEWKDKNTGEKKEKTEWHRIVVFGRMAEVCGEYLTKGQQIYVEGKLQTRQWEKDGTTHYATEIVMSAFQFVGDKQDKPRQRQQYGMTPQQVADTMGGTVMEDNSDDIPF